MESHSHALFIGGRSGAGKSTVGNEIHHLLFERKVEHGYIEGDNLDMAYPTPWEHRLAERNLAAMWANYRALGHHRLIYTNTVSVLATRELTEALGGDVTVTAVLLCADDDTTRERLSRREVGTALDLHLRRSRARAEELNEQSPPWVHRVATDRRVVTDIAEEVIALTGWTKQSG